MFIDLRQTESYSNYLKNIGWKVGKFQDIFLYSKKLLFWRFGKIQRPHEIKIKEFNDFLLKVYRFSTIYIEPNDYLQYEELKKNGLKKYNSPFLPSKTIQIDLTKSVDQLLKNMHYKTRYNIKHFLSHQNIKLTKTSNIDQFADFWQRCARKRGMFLNEKKEIVSLFNSFSDGSTIHVAQDGSGLLAAILRISTKDVSYYMYAAATNKGKKLFAPTAVAWDAIISAKNEGKKMFDFEGIYDVRFPLNSWKGFSRFKKSFGGREVEYPGTLWK